MCLLLTSVASSIGQLVTILLIFIFVLFLTYFVTRWIANYQKEKNPGDNIRILEVKRIGQNKLVEIVKIGDKTFALGMGKDEITLIGEIDEESLTTKKSSGESFSFKEFLKRAKDDGADKQ